jgi:Zn-finger nucleic acid-binding protein
MDTNEFIQKSKEIFGEDTYDYSKTVYVDKNTKVTIICKKHNREFKQTPSQHLKGAQGCEDCLNEFRSEQKRMSDETVISRAREIHGDKYDYSKMKYKNCLDPVEIICPIHGSFWQSIRHHVLRGHGCPQCNGGVLQTREEFIKKAEELHGVGKYDYSKVIYVNAITNVEIICPRCNKSFWQTPHNHLSEKAGCPQCSGIGTSKLEEEIESYLITNNISYNSQYSWDWLVFNRAQKVDFYLPDYGVVIECQGLQHFKEVDHFGGELEVTQARDQNKLKLCKEHGIKIYYFSNIFRTFQVKPDNFEYPYQVFEDIDLLFKCIIEDYENNKNQPD